MPLFDFYIMVDWSGAARRSGRRPDSIWIAHGAMDADEPVTNSPFSRTETIHLVRSVLLKEIASRHRVFVGFDFAYSYPVELGLKFSFVCLLSRTLVHKRAEGDPAAAGGLLAYGSAFGTKRIFRD